MSAKEDVEKVQKIFAYIRQQNITLEEIAGINSELKKSLLKLLCQMSSEGDLEALKQIFAYIKRENITIEEMGSITSELKKSLHDLLCQMSAEGDLEAATQIFGYINHANISEEEMGMKTNDVNQRRNSSLIDTHIGSTRYSIGQSPLISAAARGHFHVCKYLIIHQNADIEERNDEQKTALIVASEKNEIGVIKLLLDHNCNVTAQDKNGYHAAYWASRLGNLEILKLLVEKEQEVIEIKDKYGNTPLLAASINGRAYVCSYLIGMNADVNVQNELGDTALQHAVLNSLTNIVNRLPSNGAKDLKNQSYLNALDIAKIRNNEKILYILDKHFNTNHSRKM